MVDAAVQLRPETGAASLKVVIVGKLMEQRRNDRMFYSTVVAPAPDQWSQPMPFEIRSSKPLGARDEIVTVPCELTGFWQRSYDTKPDEHGEVRRVKPIRIALDALDS